MLSEAGFVLLDSVPMPEADGNGVHVYALIDPRFDDVRYVGVTNRSLLARLENHLRSPTNRRTRVWFNELRAAGLEPEIVRLQGAHRGGWDTAEMQWIAWFRARGDLLNVDDGGEIEHSGTGWDDIKQAKAAIFASSARHAAIWNPEAPPPSAQAQRRSRDRGGKRKQRPIRPSQRSLAKQAARQAVERVEAEERARQEEYERFGAGPRIYRKSR